MKFAILCYVYLLITCCIIGVLCVANGSVTGSKWHKKRIYNVDASKDGTDVSDTRYNVKLKGDISRKFRRFSISKNEANSNLVSEDCTPENSLQEYSIVRNIAKILLLNNARDLSKVLRENPSDRNDKLMRLLEGNMSENEYYFNNTLNKSRVISKIKNKFRTGGHLDEKLNQLSVYLSDFLTLKNDNNYQKEFENDSRSVEVEIKRLLYLNAEGVNEAIEQYVTQTDYNNLNENADFNKIFDDDRRAFKCTASVDGDNNNKSVLAVKTIDGINGDGEVESSSELDKSITHVQTSKGIREGAEEETSSVAKGLQFLDIPEGDDMRIHSLKLEDENPVFAVFSAFVSYLQPDEFPLGLVRDAFRKHVSLHILILQILKLEGLMLCWILFAAILSLCLPCAVVAQMCCPNRNIQRLRDDTSSASSNLNNKCTGKTAGSVLYILMLSLLCTLLLMLVANDKFSRAIEKLPGTSTVVFKDLETFIKNTQLQISFVATSSFEITMDQISGDLRDVDKLLGNSFKKDFMDETGFDKTIQSLINLKSGSAEISKRVRELLRECNVAKGTGKLLQESLSELSKQLNLARRYCTQKDRPLCESLQSTGLDLAFSVEELLADPNLQYLERITHDNKFNGSIDETVRLLNAIPKHIEAETSSHRAGILDILQQRRGQMYNSVRSLEEISRSMTTSVKIAARDILYLLENVASRDLWRYLIVVIAGFLSFVAWILFLSGSLCCCQYTKKTIPYLKLGLFIACVLSIVLWVCGSVEFLIGGHGQTIICNPLYEDNFGILSNILDKEGLLYNEGYFTYVFKANESLRTDEILRNCQRNQPSYVTFHLQNRLDVPKIFNYQSWDDLKSNFDHFHFSTNNLKVYPASLERTLEEFSSAASKNKFRDIRSKISFPVTHKDLNTFYDQIFSVAKQITNTKSATSLEKVMFKTQEIINNELAVVQNHRDSILYKLTALEILLQPVHAKVENYLDDLMNAQIYIEDNGHVLEKKNVGNFIFRLERHLHDLQKHINDQVRRKIGKCKPLWDIFHYVRHHLCKAMVDPVNALACSHYIAVLLFLCLAQVVIILISYYKDNGEYFAESMSNGHFNEEMHLRDQAVWTSPQSGSIASGNNNLPSLPPLSAETRWTIPRPPEPPPESLVPSTSNYLPEAYTSPRPPSISSMTRTTPKLVGLYAISKAKSIKTKYDPLKFIERTWKTPRSIQSPRGWL